MSTQANKALARGYFEGSKQTVFDDFLAASYVLHLVGYPEPIHGPEGTKQLHVDFFSAFPDFRTVVEDLVAEGDRVAVRYTAYATHLHSFRGVPPTGKPLSITGMSILRVADGKIVEEWAMPDIMSLLQQIDAIPAPEASTPA